MRVSIVVILCLMVAVQGQVSCQDKNSVLPVTQYKYYKWTEFSMGADLSYVNQLLDKGAQFKDSGKVENPYSIFSKYGANTVRVRLWHNPLWELSVTGGRFYSDLKDVEQTIRAAKSKGMAVSLDLHYSDDWADPSKQSKPAAWNAAGLAVLKDSVYNYTLAVLHYLEAKSLVPEMIQIGNETNNGMLFPEGKVISGSFASFGALLKSGIKAVRDFSITSTIKPLIILHVAQLQDAPGWCKGVIEQEGVTDFDIIGLSHYCKWSTVTSFSAVTDVIRTLVSKYSKRIMVVETAYSWTSQNNDTYSNLFGASDIVNGYPASPAGQHQYLKDLVKAIRDGGGTGLHYWEPAWISSNMQDRWGMGSSWENNALFDFNGNVLEGMNFYRE